MVIILKYVLLGFGLYIFVIPIVEELATLIVQWLEVKKGKLLLQIDEMQKQVDKKEEVNETSEQITNVIGFAIPHESDYEEDYEEDD